MRKGLSHRIRHSTTSTFYLRVVFKLERINKVLVVLIHLVKYPKKGPMSRPILQVTASPVQRPFFRSSRVIALEGASGMLFNPRKCDVWLCASPIHTIFHINHWYSLQSIASRYSYWHLPCVIPWVFARDQSCVDTRIPLVVSMQRFDAYTLHLSEIVLHAAMFPIYVTLRPFACVSGTMQEHWRFRQGEAGSQTGKKNRQREEKWDPATNRKMRYQKENTTIPFRFEASWKTKISIKPEVQCK